MDARECTARAIVRIEWHRNMDGAAAFRVVLACELCPASQSLTFGDLTFLRIGPNALWAVSDTLDNDEIAALTEPFAQATDAATVDVSHGFVAFAVSGAAVADLLQAGSPVDMHETACPVGTLVRTVFDGHPVTINRRAADAFDLYVDRSLARSFWQRLNRRIDKAS
jgi:sarcosine oxidase subunit gamma